MFVVLPLIAALIVGNDASDQRACGADVQREYSEPSAADFRRECVIGDRPEARVEADPLAPLHHWRAGDEEIGHGGQVSATSRIYPRDIIFRQRERTYRPRER